jgi:hypothetical protein
LNLRVAIADLRFSTKAHNCLPPQEFSVESDKLQFRRLKPELDLCLRMARVMFLDAFREQAFAPALPPARQRGAARFRFHPGTKTVLTFACSLGSLVSPFHRTDKASVGLRAVTLGMSTALSIERARFRFDGFIPALPSPPIFEISDYSK